MGRTPIPDSKMDYSLNSELWRYFGVEPPKGEPKTPSVEQAIKPADLPEGTCDSAHAAYNAAACQSYQQAWQKYETDKAEVEAYNQWEEKNTALFNALNNKVAAYNNQFRREIKDYTDFVFERRRYSDQIASSKLGCQQNPKWRNQPNYRRYFYHLWRAEKPPNSQQLPYRKPSQPNPIRRRSCCIECDRSRQRLSNQHHRF